MEDIKSYLETVLSETRVKDRPEETLASTVTSTDVKLAYDNTDDRFVSFLLGDINANPEGILVHDEKSSKDILQRTARAYLSNINKKETVVVNLPGEVYNVEADEWRNLNRWLTQDKKSITDEIQNQSSGRIYKTVDGAGIGISTNGSLKYDGDRIDGYVNLDDRGQELINRFDDNVQGMSKGSNAPAGVWNTDYFWSGKLGLLYILSDISNEIECVHIPDFIRLNELSDAGPFIRKTDRGGVLKGPYGTWGDEIVPIDKKRINGNRNSKSLINYIDKKVRKKEMEVRNKRGYNEFSLLNQQDGTISISNENREASYGLIEEIIAGEIYKNNHRYEIISLPKRCHPNNKTTPIDFIPLTLRWDVDEGMSVPSVMVRMSAKDDLNANADNSFISYESIETTLRGEVAQADQIEQIPEFTFDLRAHLETVAGRRVESEEIIRPIRTAGLIAQTVRNVSANKIESSYV